MHEKHMKWIYWLAFTLATISWIGVIALIIAEVYVRWFINQNFTFLGGGGLPALIVSTFGLLLGLVYIQRK